jgi:hypothetical protein
MAVTIIGLPAERFRDDLKAAIFPATDAPPAVTGR